MNEEEKQEIRKAREYKVAKSNDLVRKSRYDFTLNEQRTIAYICSKIKPRDIVDRVKETPYELEYEFNILDYVRTCGIQDNGRVYEEVKTTLKGLRDKSMWLKKEDGSETTVGWLDKATTNKKSGLAKIRLDEDLVPYLFDLQEKFLSYGLYNVLNMKSQYALRLYELLKSYHDEKIAQTDNRSPIDQMYSPKKISWTIEVEELKKLLMVENVKSYERYPNFKQKVLTPAQAEINKLTDINIYYEPIKKGNRTIKLKFTIVNKVPRDRDNAHFDNLIKLEEADNLADRQEAVSHEEEHKTIKLTSAIKSRPLTDEEKAQYERITQGAIQLKLDFDTPKMIEAPTADGEKILIPADEYYKMIESWKNS